MERKDLTKLKKELRQERAMEAAAKETKWEMSDIKSKHKMFIWVTSLWHKSDW